jgi:hypothetical protein
MTQDVVEIRYSNTSSNSQASIQKIQFTEDDIRRYINDKFIEEIIFDEVEETALTEIQEIYL